MIYIYSWINYYPIYLVAALPKSLIIDHNLAQLFMFPFQYLGLAHLSFALISYIPLAIEFELKDGSIKHIIKFFLLNFTIGAIHAFTLFGYSSIYPKHYDYYMYFPCTGLWPINLEMMVEKFSQYGDQYIGFLFMPFKIKAKLYPACVLIFWFLAYGYIWELVIGALVGYICNK